MSQKERRKIFKKILLDTKNYSTSIIYKAPSTITPNPPAYAETPKKTSCCTFPSGMNQHCSYCSWTTSYALFQHLRQEEQGEEQQQCSWTKSLTKYSRTVTNTPEYQQIKSSEKGPEFNTHFCGKTSEQENFDSAKCDHCLDTIANEVLDSLEFFRRMESKLKNKVEKDMRATRNTELTQFEREQLEEIYQESFVSVLDEWRELYGKPGIGHSLPSDEFVEDIRRRAHRIELLRQEKEQKEKERDDRIRNIVRG